VARKFKSSPHDPASEDANALPSSGISALLVEGQSCRSQAHDGAWGFHEDINRVHYYFVLVYLRRDKSL
jgi:hypothetical protein